MGFISRLLNFTFSPSRVRMKGAGWWVTSMVSARFGSSSRRKFCRSLTSATLITSLAKFWPIIWEELCLETVLVATFEGPYRRTGPRQCRSLWRRCFCSPSGRDLLHSPPEIWVACTSWAHWSTSRPCGWPEGAPSGSCPRLWWAWNWAGNTSSGKSSQ